MSDRMATMSGIRGGLPCPTAAITRCASCRTFVAVVGVFGTEKCPSAVVRHDPPTRKAAVFPCTHGQYQ